MTPGGGNTVENWAVSEAASKFFDELSRDLGDEVDTYSQMYHTEDDGVTCLYEIKLVRSKILPFDGGPLLASFGPEYKSMSYDTKEGRGQHKTTRQSTTRSRDDRGLKHHIHGRVDVTIQVIHPHAAVFSTSAES